MLKKPIPKDMKLSVILFVFFIFENAYGQSADCKVYAEDYIKNLYSLSDLQINCYQGGGHLPISDEEIKKSCDELASAKQLYEQTVSSCSLGTAQKKSCEQQGGTWKPNSLISGDDGEPYWVGQCASGCPGNLTEAISGSDRVCLCPEGSAVAYILPNQSVDQCKDVSSSMCAQYINQFTKEVSPNAPEECLSGVSSLQEQNANAALEEAKRIAEEQLKQKLENKKNELINACTAKHSNYYSVCSSLSVQSVNSGNESVTNACESALSEKKDLKSKMAKCISKYQSISCTSSTGQLAAVGRATKGSGAAQVTKEYVAQRAEAVDYPPYQESSGLNSKMQSSLSQVDNVIAGLKNCGKAFANDAKDNTVAAVKAPTATTAPSSSFKNANSSGSEDSNELGSGSGGGSSFGSGLVGGLASIANNFTGNESQGELGSGGSSPQAVPAPNPSNPYGKSGSGSFSATEGYSKDTPRYGGGELGVSGSSFPDETIYGQTDKKNKGFNASTGSGNGGGRGGSPGYGSPYGGGGYGSGASLPGGSSSNNSAGSGQKRTRNYASMEKRNLVAGFKAVKPSDGGGILSIKPADYKKYGSKKLKEKLQDARGRYEKKMPLIFRNGKFVLDFLAMKESEEFKNKNKAMERFWKGENINGDKSDATNPPNSEINPNESHHIFRIIHLKYQKALYGI